MQDLHASTQPCRDRAVFSTQRTLHKSCAKPRNRPSRGHSQLNTYWRRCSLLSDLVGRFKPETHKPELVKVPLDAEDEGGLGGTSDGLFGPLAALLIGYSQWEADTFRKAMNDMEADMVQISCCNGPIMQGTLAEAFSQPVPLYEQPPLGSKRAVILSGMSAAEVMEVIGAYRDAGLPETVWAAAVPANFDRKVADLVDDIYGDHIYMKMHGAPR